MTRPRGRPSTNDDIFGVPALAMLAASSTRPIDEKTRFRLMSRLELALADLHSSQAADTTLLQGEKAVCGWRDITDAMNFMQSTIEMGVTRDEDATVPAIKEALGAGAIAFEKTGAPRLSPEHLQLLGTCIVQFRQLIDEISGRDYWRVAIHTQKRVTRLRMAAKGRRGDVVVSL